MAQSKSPEDTCEENDWIYQAEEWGRLFQFEFENGMVEAIGRKLYEEGAIVDYWIGLSRDTSQGTWQWLDG